MSTPSTCLYVHRWAVWPCSIQNEHEQSGVDVPPCSFIEAGLRRRLSPLAKIALSLAYQCIEEEFPIKTIFASRHGELNRTHQMLESIMAGEEVSPTRFSLSVHNAIPGLLSILRKDGSATTALSAGAGSLGYGLLQAALEQLSCPADPVLLIYADVALENDFYNDAEDANLNAAFAALLKPGGQCIQLEHRVEDCNPGMGLSLRSLADVLNKKVAEALLPDGRGSWRVRYVE